MECRKIPKKEFCPRCAVESSSAYDHRWVQVKDAPLSYFERLTIERYLENYPDLKELYFAKEALHRLYRMRGFTLFQL